MTEFNDGAGAHVDHVGSLVRPPELMACWRAHEKGSAGDDELKAVQDTAIRDAVKLQEECGLSVVTDGEFRRGGWSRGFMEATGAFGFKPSKLVFRNEDGIETAGDLAKLAAAVRDRSRLNQRLGGRQVESELSVTLPTERPGDVDQRITLGDLDFAGTIVAVGV